MTSAYFTYIVYHNAMTIVYCIVHSLMKSFGNLADVSSAIMDTWLELLPHPRCCCLELALSSKCLNITFPAQRISRLTQTLNDLWQCVSPECPGLSRVHAGKRSTPLRPWAGVENWWMGEIAINDLQKKGMKVNCLSLSNVSVDILHNLEKD